MADFSKNEIIEDEGGLKIVFDLDEDTIASLESVLGIKSDSPHFSEHFENFVNAGIKNYLLNQGSQNE
jgi:hypothetical protein